MNALVALGADMQANGRRRSDATARRGAYKGHVEAMKVLRRWARTSRREGC